MCPVTSLEHHEYWSLPLTSTLFPNRFENDGPLFETPSCHLQSVDCLESAPTAHPACSASLKKVGVERILGKVYEALWLMDLASKECVLRWISRGGGIHRAFDEQKEAPSVLICCVDIPTVIGSDRYSHTGRMAFTKADRNLLIPIVQPSGTIV